MKSLLLGAVVLPLILLLFAGRQTNISTSEGTAKERIQFRSDGLMQFRQSPLFGIGVNEYDKNIGHVAHNSYIHIFVELGLVGGFFYVDAFALALESFYRLGVGRRILDPELRRLHPYLFAVLVAWATGMLSLTLCYIMLQPLLPPRKPRRFRYPGRKPIEDRQALTGILFVLKTGIRWEDLPIEMGCGCGMTCWRRLRDWKEADVWARLHQVLLQHLDDAHLINWTRAAIDSTFARAFEGVEGSGKNPTDRGRPGVKQHILVDANGVPLAGDITPANVPEVKELLPLVDRCGPQDEGGEPQRRPEKLYADRAYDSEPHREELRKRGMEPRFAKRNTEHGSGLGVYRWVAERTIAWLHGFRKLRFVTEKTQEMQFAFFNPGLALICFRFL